MTERFETFVTTIANLNRCIQRIKAREMAAIGMKGTQTMCLYTLGRSADGLTAAQLCRECGEDKAAISRTVKELTELGCTAEVGNPGKRSYRAKIVLTEKGRQVLAYIDERVSRVLATVDDSMNSVQRRNFYTVLEDISARLTDYAQQGEAAPQK